MSVFSNIMRKIFPVGHPAIASSPAAAPTTKPSPAREPFSGTPAVDVEATLNTLARKNSQKLNWKTSIVDLLKLLELDSSMEARKSLAQELHYTGDMNDSAGMNIWLHKQVMTKLAENGGTVPDDLKH